MTEVLDRQQLLRERTRADILAAAWELAERDGLVAMSLRDLAAAVGMRAPSLYTYFDGKDAIYDAMFAQGYEQLLAKHETWIDAIEELAPLEALTYAVQRWIEFCQASIPRYQLMFTHVIPGWTPSPETYAVSERAYQVMAEALAVHGVGGGAELDLYTALTSGLAAQQIANDPGGDRWLRQVPDAMQMFLEYTGAIDKEPS